MQLKLDALRHLFGQRVAVESLGSVVGKLCQIVSLELNSVKLVDASELLYLALGFLL